MAGPTSVRDATASDRDWIARLLVDRWGSTRVVSNSRVHDADALPAKVATRDGTLAGLATFHLDDGGCERVTLDALIPDQGVGSGLLYAVAQEARRRGARRLWLITTNDNLDALRFYQRRGMRISAIHRGAVDQRSTARRSRPRRRAPIARSCAARRAAVTARARGPRRRRSSGPTAEHAETGPGLVDRLGLVLVDQSGAVGTFTGVLTRRGVGQDGGSPTGS
jgi:N-acetylglutamate synthase-like GNAT family acetyltransferase